MMKKLTISSTFAMLIIQHFLASRSRSIYLWARHMTNNYRAKREKIISTNISEKLWRFSYNDFRVTFSWNFYYFFKSREKYCSKSFPPRCHPILQSMKWDFKEFQRLKSLLKFHNRDFNSKNCSILPHCITYTEASLINKMCCCFAIVQSPDKNFSCMWSSRRSLINFCV